LAVVGCRSPSQANPSPFPDLGNYTPVNVAEYTVSLPNNGRPTPLYAVYFLTPKGIPCTFISTPAARCTSNHFPGVPPVAGGVSLIGTDTNFQTTNDPVAADNNTVGYDQPIRTLPPLHSIIVDGVICGVDDAGTMACKDPQGRGFVLSPHGSGWLAHV
jgi:hypothetical protein